MKASEARALLLNRKLSYEDYVSPIPGVPELDNQLGLLELRGADTVHAEKLAKVAGTLDEGLMLAGIVIKSLVLRETKERLFSDTDIESVSGFGLSVLKPLAEKIKKLSGLDEEAVTDAKKNLKKTTEKDSNSPLQGS